MSTAAFNSALNMAGSYYAATANAAPAWPSLETAIDADVCVVGGGCTGLSAALHLAARGHSIVLLEGGRIGWGASGRNGGQLIPGLRKGAVELVRTYGAQRARILFDLSLEARQLVLDLIQRFEIRCDLKLTGHLSAAAKRSDVEAMHHELECLHRVMNYSHARFVDAEVTRAEVAAAYHGGVIDDFGGHFHPLNYTLGLARATHDTGVRMFEHSPAISLHTGSQGVLIRTPRGEVRARRCVLAGDALLGNLHPEIAARMMPIASFIGVTEPLSEPHALIAHDRAVSDSRFVVNYFRLTPDGRLLFGGGERYSIDEPRDIAGFVRPYILKVFPQLRGTRIEYAWGGLVSVTRTRMPHVGRNGDVYYAHGYSGMGAILSSFAGKLLADAIAGDSRALDAFAAIAPPRFPGGTRLRTPLHMLAMLWFAMRDRL